MGYGDFSPQNEDEHICCIFIMVLGVAMFAYVMGTFTDLVTSYDIQLGKVQKDTNLQNWLNLLTKFKRVDVIEGDLLAKIDEHFEYFWDNDRNHSITLDCKYLAALQPDLRYKIMDYLWGDVLTNFWTFFYYFSPYTENFTEFYYQVSFLLLPRRFMPSELIYNPDEEVQEMYLILDGKIEVGYQGINNLEFVKAPFIGSNYSVNYIGDYYILYNEQTKYYYKGVSEVKFFGINKYEFNKLIQDYNELHVELRKKAYIRYYATIKNCVDLHIEKDIIERNKIVNQIKFIKNSEEEVSNIHIIIYLISILIIY